MEGDETDVERVVIERVDLNVPQLLALALKCLVTFGIVGLCAAIPVAFLLVMIGGLG